MQNKRVMIAKANQSWKARAIARDEETLSGLTLAALAASIGLVGLAALVWINTAAAAMIKPQAAAILSCESKLSNLYLAGTFVMPGTGDAMNLWVGKPTGASATDKEVWGLVGKTAAVGCEAQCKVTRFERFKKDLKPAIMELDCEGSRLKTMRMPLHIQWAAGGKNAGETTVRLGSSIYGVEEAPLRVQVNRYAVASK